MILSAILQRMYKKHAQNIMYVRTYFVSTGLFLNNHALMMIRGTSNTQGC
jgi:hypothetical protein